jgi:hypothetical protein
LEQTLLTMQVINTYIDTVQLQDYEITFVLVKVRGFNVPKINFLWFERLKKQRPKMSLRWNAPWYMMSLITPTQLVKTSLDQKQQIFYFSRNSLCTEFRWKPDSKYALLKEN